MKNSRIIFQLKKFLKVKWSILCGKKEIDCSGVTRNDEKVQKRKGRHLGWTSLTNCKFKWALHEKLDKTNEWHGQQNNITIRLLIFIAICSCLTSFFWNLLPLICKRVLNLPRTSINLYLHSLVGCFGQIVNLVNGPQNILAIVLNRFNYPFWRDN